MSKFGLAGSEIQYQREISEIGSYKDRQIALIIFKIIVIYMYERVSHPPHKAKNDNLSENVFLWAI